MKAADEHLQGGDEKRREQSRRFFLANWIFPSYWMKQVPDTVTDQ